MFNFLKKFFHKNTNICAAIDIGSYSVKTVVFDLKENSNKILSYGESIQNISAMKNGMISDLKSVIVAVNSSLDIAENKIGSPVQKVVFGVNADRDMFYQKSFRGYLQTIIDEVGGKSLGFYSLPRIYPCVLNNKKNYLLIDIGANTTSIVLVRDGSFKKSESFSIGSSIFTKRIAKLFALSFEEADKVKISYSLGRAINYKISNSDFQHDLDLWITAFYISIKNFSEDNLPNIVFLTGGGSLFPLMKDALKSGSFPYKRLKFIDKPIIEHLNFNRLKIDKFKRNNQSVPWNPVYMLGSFTLHV